MGGRLTSSSPVQTPAPSTWPPAAPPVRPAPRPPAPPPPRVPGPPRAAGPPPLLMPPLVVPAPQPPESCSQVSSRKPPRKQPSRATAARLTSTDPRTMAASIHDRARATDPLRARERPAIGRPPQHRGTRARPRRATAAPPRLVDDAELARIDPDLRCVENCNTPAEYAQALARAEPRPPAADPR